MTRPQACRADPGGSLLDKLRGAVRPEFAVEAYFPDPDDPVLGRGRCAVAGCGRLSWGRGLCTSHYDRWRRAGQPEVVPWITSAAPLAARAGLRKTQCYDLRPLPAQLRLEVGYALQCRRAERGAGPNRAAAARAVRLLALGGSRSILDRSPEGWLELARAQGWRDLACMVFVRYIHARVGELAAPPSLEDEHQRDTWDTRRLGIPTRSSNHLIRFEPIRQPWLRQATKRWARFRLATGRAVGTVANNVHALGWFSSFLAEARPGAADESALTREVLEHYLSWLASARLADQTRLGYLARSYVGSDVRTPC